MAKLKQIRSSTAFQSAEDAFGAVALFVLLFAGLILTGPA